MSSQEVLDMVIEALEQPDNSVIFKHTGLNELKKELEKAEKQEKLLGHYKDLAEVRKELYYLMTNFPRANKDRVIILSTQETLVSNIIKELEK